MIKWEIYRNKKTDERIIVQYDFSGKPIYIALFNDGFDKQFSFIRNMLKSGLNLSVMERSHNLMNYIWFDTHDFLDELKAENYEIIEDDSYDYELVKQYFDSMEDSMV